ncbi:SDR family NAD(P)-dependent oxidoreductase [Aquamicrobium sp.]|uniref:SDR family NAD(P)-dependent oxidoreductase n=1 Tax=Aquamicrobium sp. TaxID=1872579 RepID=UPI0025850BD5|nr:SDR family NAD(P)-dependent oxidoreductase [Aquamicrobium sp.]MCK9552091.1 SDR family NAD(P)-dependent oxidoreductase [Aquamicrobium sp.]
MGLYRANPQDGVVWITGGSSGIGRALAKMLAAAGYTVAVTAREGDEIEALIAESAPLSGRILSYPCDVTDEARLESTLAAIESVAGPVVLAIFNAGTYVPVAGENLSVRKFRRTFDLNLQGVINGLVPVARRMQKRGFGHIVLLGSISAWFGWPTTAAYGASKAAINVMAQSLKYDFDKINIRIQVANPGFVNTPLLQLQQTASMVPALMSPEDAASRMLRGITRGGFEIAFPKRLVWGLKLTSMLPQPVRHWVINRLTRWSSRPLSFGRAGSRRSNDA